MALSIYSELIGSISSWLDGSDLGGREADFVALCEDEINARLAMGLQQGAVIRPMAERGPLTIDGEYVDLPDGNMVLPISIEIGGLAAPWEVKFTSARRLLGMKSEEECARVAVQLMAGAAVPRFYAVIGDQLRFFPAPEQSFAAEFTRFSKVPALSEEVTSNWLLASHRNAYLYGALAQAELFGWNDARMANVATLFEQAVDGIIARYPMPVDQASLTSEIARFGIGGRDMELSSFLNGSL
jgi:hypothetical protein